MEFVIRPYVKSDEEYVKKLIMELKHFESRFDNDYMTDEKSVEKLFLNITNEKNKGGEIFIAEHEGMVIGFVSLSISSKNDELILKKVNAVYISDILISEGYRNKGVGTALIKKAEDFARKNNIRFLKLVVFSENKAKKLYDKLGFVDYETTMLKELK